MVSETNPIDAYPIAEWVGSLGAPATNETELIDARELPPPEPLSKTLERLPELDGDVTLVQLNDRAPQFLYPKLDERGYTYATEDVEEGVITAIWR